MPKQKASKRTLQYTFEIPFGGNPADLCEQAIRRRIIDSTLNSMSTIHPDIRVSVVSFDTFPGASKAKG